MASGFGADGEGSELKDLFVNTTLPGFFVLFASVVLFMKLISYAHVNYDYRLAAREAANVPMDQVAGVIAKFSNTVEDTENLKRYLYNISMGDLYYFGSPRRSPTSSTFRAARRGGRGCFCRSCCGCASSAH